MWLTVSICFSYLDTLNNLAGADKWFIGNYMRAFGPFRINYDIQNWVLLIEQLVKNPNVYNFNFPHFYLLNYLLIKLNRLYQSMIAIN